MGSRGSRVREAEIQEVRPPNQTDRWLLLYSSHLQTFHTVPLLEKEEDLTPLEHDRSFNINSL